MYLFLKKKNQIYIHFHLGITQLVEVIMHESYGVLLRRYCQQANIKVHFEER